MAAAVLATACQTTDTATARYSVGTAVTDSLQIGSKQIPLPAGKWTVASHRISPSTAGTPMHHVALVDTRKNAKAILVVFSINVEGANRGMAGWQTLPACFRDDMHFAYAGESVAGGNQACWFINHSPMTTTNRSAQIYRDVMDYVKSHGIRVPINTIYAGYRIADSLDALTIHYYFNPEADGFVPPSATNWRSSDWHKDRVYLDPSKVAYIEKMKRQGADLFEQLKLGFAGKLTAARQ
jgi:hypothetical protein